MNWKQIIDEIKSTGMTQREIADEIGVSVGALSELKDGKICDPRWSRGDALLALHRKLRRKINMVSGNAKG